MVLAPAADLVLEADLPLAEAFFPFEEEADFPFAEADLEVADFAVEDFAPEADLEPAEVDFAEADLLAVEADLLVPVAFFAVPADLEVLPAALLVAAFLAPVAGDFEAADLVAEDLVPVAAVFLAVEAEADLPVVAAFFVPTALAVVDFAEVDLGADFEVADLPAVEDFFAVVDFEAEDLEPLTAFIALEAASSTAETAFVDIFFAALAMLFTMPEVLLAFVFFVEVAISF